MTEHPRASPAAFYVSPAAIVAPTEADADAGTALAPRRILRDGFVIALLNPKTAPFFAAFLPQFIDPAASAAQQSALFGAALVAIAPGTDSAYVLAAGAAAPALRNFERASAIGRQAAAAVYFGLALFTAAH